MQLRAEGFSNFIMEAGRYIVIAVHFITQRSSAGGSNIIRSAMCDFVGV